MQVILLERVSNLGQMGSVVTVKPGYARNFLLPFKKALRATKQNIVEFEKRKVELEATNISKRTDAQDLAQKIHGTILTVIRQAGDSGHLYGSVAPRDVVQGLNDRGILVDRTQVRLHAPIKDLGLHTCEVVLHPEVSVQIELMVAQTAEEAQTKIQALRRGD